MDSLCFLTKRLGQEVSPYIKKQSDKLLKSKDQPDGATKRSKTMDGVIEVASSSLQGTLLYPLVPCLCCTLMYLLIIIIIIIIMSFYITH